MTLLRHCRHFLLFVTLLLAAGHSHQTLGRFLVHHHDAAEATLHQEYHQTDNDPRPDNHDEKDAEHMAEHATFAAIMPGLFVSAPLELHALARVNVALTRSAEPRVYGIDHPPQLLG